MYQKKNKSKKAKGNKKQDPIFQEPKRKKKESKKEKKHAYNTIKSMIEIIWNNIRKNVRKALDLKKGKKAKKDEQ